MVSFDNRIHRENLEDDKVPEMRILESKSAFVGAIIVGIFLLVAILADWIAPKDPYEQSLRDRLKPPGVGRWFGTDDFGRDVLSRVIYGSRISLYIGVLSVGMAMTAGCIMGLIAGYYGGWLDGVIMRIMDVMLALPSILFAIVIVAILGPSLTNAIFAVSIVTIPQYARLMRASVMSIKTREFVTASRAVGAGDLRIILTAILPNTLAPIIVQSTLSMGTAILDAAGLSFLGLGARPPLPEWGAMINQSREFLRSAWWTVTAPGCAILLVVLGFNLLGDGLRDILDPRLR
jgi:peptide/nickel transport system permease protein